MNETMQHDDEDRLRRLLHERAEMARPSPFARAAVQRKIDALAPRARVSRRVAAAVAVLAAAGIGVLTQTTGPVMVTADGGGGAPRTEATPVPTTVPPAVASRPLPRLVLGDERFSVRDLQEHESDPAVDEPGGVYSQVFRSASDAVAAPSLTVRSIAPGVGYGIGEDAPAEFVQRVDVAGRVGFLVQAEALSPSLGVRFDDGSAVHLKAVGMPGDALVEIARSMERRPGAPGWNLAISAMSPIAEGEVRFGGSRSSELDYAAAGDEQVTIRVAQGDRLRFEDQLLDRADAAATYEAVTVRGQSGVLFAVDNEYLALWYEDGIIGEVRSTLDRDATVALLEGLREVPEAAWDSLRR